MLLVCCLMLKTIHSEPSRIVLISQVFRRKVIQLSNISISPWDSWFFSIAAFTTIGGSESRGERRSARALEDTEEQENDAPRICPLLKAELFETNQFTCLWIFLKKSDFVSFKESFYPISFLISSAWAALAGLRKSESGLGFSLGLCSRTPRGRRSDETKLCDKQEPRERCGDFWSFLSVQGEVQIRTRFFW